MSEAKERVLYSPGMRLRIRDAEWFVKKVAPVKTGGQALYVRGITSPVQGRDQIFWTKAESDGIEVILPENVELKLDTSSHGIMTRLRVESMVRHNPVLRPEIVIAHHAAMDVMNYQLQPAAHALNSTRDPRSRILIADAVGLGKTLEAGILLSELIVRGAAKRILVVTLKSMMAQFQKEMWCRFSIPLIRLDSAGLQRIRQDIPSHHNPFNYYDKTIISIDTLKQDNQFQAAMEEARWDVIVIDEAHNVAARKGDRGSLRHRLAEKLARRCDHMILLSATPHDGSRESFASLMSLLDPLAISNPTNYKVEDIQNLFERRFKKHVADEIARNFPERILHPIESSNSLPESALCHRLGEISFEMDGRKRGAETMFRTTLMKALLSSPAAFISTAANRKAKLERERPDSLDISLLDELIGLAEEITPDDFTKYRNLVKDLKTCGWNKRDPNDRVVIFTESIPTKRFLEKHLVESIGGLKPENVKSIDGSMKDVDLMRVVEEFSLEQSKIRILIASDVASEGINLHECAHRLYHFDIPWSLITFQQRNGRIDRYGQSKQPIITFMLSAVDEKQGDMNVLKHVIAREQAAHDNIGDPGQLMQVYDVDEEEKIVARSIAAVAAGADANAALDGEIAAAAKDGIEADLQQTTGADEADFWSFMKDSQEGFKDSDIAAGKSFDAVARLEPPKLFPEETDYLGAGLAYMKSVTKNQEDFGSLTQDPRYPKTWKLTIQEGLKAYCKHVLPYELRKVLRDASELELTADPKEMMAAVRRSRSLAKIEADEEGKAQEVWPSVSYLWPLNPISNWITENVNATFGSKAAPVLYVKGAERIPPTFLILAQVPNQHGEPLMQQWMSVSFPNGPDEPCVMSGAIEHLLAPYGINQQDFANTAQTDEALDADTLARLNACRAPAVYACRGALEDLLVDFAKVNDEVNGARLRALDQRFDAFGQQEFSFLDDLPVGIRAAQKSRIDKFNADRRKAYENFKQWVETHRQPSAYRHCQIVAVLLSK